MARRRSIFYATILACLFCFGFIQSINAEEAPSTETDLALLIAHKDPDNPNGEIRITLENRGEEPTAVIPPPDIFPRWSRDGWWWCQSFTFHLRAPDGTVSEYQSYQPRPPAVFPPSLPKIVELTPGRSIDVPFTLTLPQAVAEQDPGAPPVLIPSMQGFGKVFRGVKPGTYHLTVTYDPGYHRDTIPALPADKPQKPSPLIGKKLTSNTLEFEIELVKKVEK